ncbi:MAG: hypothetical protein LBT43_13490 [Prevotella sp.]|jgi:hypothetical protein|nr:hypothetical protein [Prevotella sp.]
MKIYSSLLGVIIILFSSCNDKKYQHIMDNKEELMKLSLHQTISNNKDRGNSYYIETYSSDNKLKNQYFFQKEETDGKFFYTLNYVDIQFSPDSIIGIDWFLERDTTKVCRYYEEMSTIIKSYGIKALVGRRYPNSPYLELIIYLEGWGGVLEYYSKGEPNYPDYKRIAEGWYLGGD